MFKIVEMRDAAGHVWHKQGDFEQRLNYGVAGEHASTIIQCERCWMINLEGRLPIPGKDDLYVACIRRATRDNAASRAISTIKSHSQAVTRMVRDSEELGSSPFLPP